MTDCIKLPDSGQRSPTPTEIPEPERWPSCEICGSLATMTAFLADAGMLNLCWRCYDLFGFGGENDTKTP